MSYSFLQRERKKTGQSQEELARKVGVSRQTIAAWERGLDMRASLMPSLLDALDYGLGADMFLHQWVISRKKKELA